MTCISKDYDLDNIRRMIQRDQAFKDALDADLDYSAKSKLF